MSKPQMKKEVAINTVDPLGSYITFFATPDATKEFEQFGRVSPALGNKDLYGLTVDRRYDFYEVVKYIENY